MAFSSKLLCFFLFTTLFIISTQARDIRFYSRFNPHPDPTTTTTTNTNTATEFYNPTTSTTTNQNDEFSSFNKQNEQEIDSVFTPETSDGAAYGLYAHETDLFSPPPTTTTTTTTTTKINDNAFETKNSVPELKGLNEFTNNENKDNVNVNGYYYDQRNYKINGNGEGVGSYGGVQKQGMSDTRYLENGRYFYDVNTEKNNNQNNYKGVGGVNYGANYMSYNANNGGNYKENVYSHGNNDGFYRMNGNNFNGTPVKGGYQEDQKTINDEFAFDP